LNLLDQGREGAARPIDRLAHVLRQGCSGTAHGHQVAMPELFERRSQRNALCVVITPQSPVFPQLAPGREMDQQHVTEDRQQTDDHEGAKKPGVTGIVGSRLEESAAD
jgi:hypothetical protein